MIGNFAVLDERFGPLVPERGSIQMRHNQGTFTEGPVWFGDLQMLVWSDIMSNRMLRLTPDGQVGLFRGDSYHSNGNTRDLEGRLVTCEHSGRRVTRTEADGRITVIADAYQGRKLNSPNDVVVKSDGSIWFTDPEYGLRINVPGGTREQPRENVYRVDPDTGEVAVAVDDFDKPNGLAFSPDESLLYVADSAITDGPGLNSHIRRFHVGATGGLSGGEVFATTIGIPDGMRVDTDGNLWASAGNKIDVYAPEGTLIGQVRDFPMDVTNLTFGGVHNDEIFITGGHFLFSVKVNARGAQRP